MYYTFKVFLGSTVSLKDSISLKDRWNDKNLSHFNINIFNSYDSNINKPSVLMGEKMNEIWKNPQVRILWFINKMWMKQFLFPLKIQ